MHLVTVPKRLQLLISSSNPPGLQGDFPYKMPGIQCPGVAMGLELR